ncbi:flagellar protein FliS [Roseospira visakhapatnamensis]|uniref:Flagellar protein FliS n=1 Tax=Roseospira visakhapatnamensis TaxID=390880 RepID=A0A7W6RBJ4_9PROT|nr:flagellar protein FliS [Roseospira visakhapatnamensis]MBB4265510.1 flagellar protein FliS [Roseospira visakhapatnamensis]
MTTLATANAIAAYGQARRRQPPLKLIVEVYDMALTLVARARAARAEGVRDSEIQALTLAGRILEELEGCLNRRDPRARPMSDALSGYYRTVMAQLHKATRSQGDEALERYGSVHRQLLVMRDAWAAVAGMAPLTGKTRLGNESKDAQTQDAAKITE